MSGAQRHVAEQVLEGIVERIVFQSAATQFTVARIRRDDDSEVTAVGALLGIGPGTPVILRGAWVTDPRFGPQFRITSYQTRSPETLLGLERYLGSGLIPGVGPELARRIVARFGLNTLELITADPRRLEEVDGIGAARAASIASAFASHAQVQEVMVFLRGHGVSPALCARIYKRYGDATIGVVRENPYRLALDVWGIGFRTADAIAMALGLARDAPARIEAGVLHVLGKLAESGHMHVPEEDLCRHATTMLEVDEDAVTGAIARLDGESLIVREALGDRGMCASVTALWDTERDAAAALATLAATPMRAPRLDIETAIAAFETRAGIELAPEQKRAVRTAVIDKCVVVTGGPGVGKTTIVRGIAGITRAEHRALALAAPTGRAAKRLSEATGMPALTIHRLLELNPRTSTFERNADNPLDADTVIIDEASMVDCALFRALVVALLPSAQLILVGDVDQLPSVGPGAVLADVIASGAASVVRLTEIFRQAAESQIVINAHRINDGEGPLLAPPPGNDPSRTDFYFVARDDPAAACATVVDLVAERIPKSFGFDPFLDVQVLAPMHRGQCGTTALNLALQERLNPLPPGARDLARGARAFRAGDKVMQTRNDYEREIYNGDIGVIASLASEGGGLVVELSDGRRIDYERDDLDQLMHAFAVSIHKSQGSEYPAVVIPLVTQHYMMLERTLLYTAVTRGKQLVVLVGAPRAIAMAVENTASRTRHTWLAERIRTALEATHDL